MGWQRQMDDVHNAYSNALHVQFFPVRLFSLLGCKSSSDATCRSKVQRMRRQDKGVRHKVTHRWQLYHTHESLFDFQETRMEQQFILPLRTKLNQIRNIAGDAEEVEGGAASCIKPDEYDAQDKQKSIWWSQEGRSSLVNMLATCFRFGSDGGRNLSFWWPCFDEFVLPPAGYSVPWELFRFGCFKRYSKSPEYKWMNFPLFIWLQGTGERIWKHMLVTVQWLVLGSM